MLLSTVFFYILIEKKGQNKRFDGGGKETGGFFDVAAEVHVRQVKDGR